MLEIKLNPKQFVTKFTEQEKYNLNIVMGDVKEINGTIQIMGKTNSIFRSNSYGITNDSNSTTFEILMRHYVNNWNYISKIVGYFNYTNSNFSTEERNKIEELISNINEFEHIFYLLQIVLFKFDDSLEFLDFINQHKFFSYSKYGSRENKGNIYSREHENHHEYKKIMSLNEDELTLEFSNISKTIVKLHEKNNKILRDKSIYDKITDIEYVNNIENYNYEEMHENRKNKEKIKKEDNNSKQTILFGVIFYISSAIMTSIFSILNLLFSKNILWITLISIPIWIIVYVIIGVVWKIKTTK